MDPWISLLCSPMAGGGRSKPTAEMEKGMASRNRRLGPWARRDAEDGPK